MSFSHKYNTDDVIIRAAIIGLVNELNNRIYFYNTWEDDRREIVRVPFFYAMSGDERFLQDAFSNWNDCYPDFIEGNTDPIPRGTIYLSGVSVLSSNLTSRFVRGNYTKEVDGQLKRFNSYINSIPIQLNFSAEILIDTSVDSLKIIQSAISVLYRTLVFSVNYDGFRVPTQAGFPDSFTPTKQFEFTYGQADRLKVTFDIECQTFLPIPDQSQEFFSGNNMSGGIGVQSSVNPNTPGATSINQSGNSENLTITPSDVPNISPNEEMYRYPDLPGVPLNEPDSSNGQTQNGQNGQNGEGPTHLGENWGGEFWR